MVKVYATSNINEARYFKYIALQAMMTVIYHFV